MVFNPKEVDSNLEKEIKKVEKCLDYLFKLNRYEKHKDSISIYLSYSNLSNYQIKFPLSKEVIDGVADLYQKAGWSKVIYCPESAHYNQDKEVIGKAETYFTLYY